MTINKNFFNFFFQSSIRCHLLLECAVDCAGIMHCDAALIVMSG